MDSKKLNNLAVLLLASLAVVGVLAFLFYAGFCFYASKTYPAQIEKELQAIKAQGQPISQAQLIPPQVSPQENAAIDYLKALKAALKLPVPAENSSAFYRQYKKQMTVLLASTEPVFAALKAGYEKPACRYDFSHGAAGLREDMEKMEPGRLVNLTLIKVYAQTDQGDLLGAAQTMTYCLRFVRRLQPDSYLTSGAERQLLLASLHKGITYMFNGGFQAYNRPLVEEVRAVVNEDKQVWLRAFYGERAQGIDLLSQTPKNIEVFTRQIHSCHQEHLDNLVKVLKGEYNSPFRGMLYYEKLTYLKWWGRVIAEYQKSGVAPVNKSGVVFLKSSDFFCTYTLSASYTLCLTYPDVSQFNRQYEDLEKKLMAFQKPVAE